MHHTCRHFIGENLVYLRAIEIAMGLLSFAIKDQGNVLSVIDKSLCLSLCCPFSIRVYGFGNPSVKDIILVLNLLNDFPFTFYDDLSQAVSVIPGVFCFFPGTLFMFYLS
jgi:hypothetical protein